MNLEQRLQHAARDLREVPVAVPPLGGRSRARPKAHAIATPVLVPLLFVAGTLFAIGATGAGVEHPVQSDLPTVRRSVDPSTDATPVEAEEQPVVRSIDAPSALVELQMIAEFVSGAQSGKPPTSPDAIPDPPTGPTAPPGNVIGAI